MEGEDLGQRHLAALSDSLSPPRSVGMQAGALEARQGAVRDLLDENVTEAVAITFRRPDQVAVGKVLAELLHMPGLATFERGDARGAKRAPEDAAQLDDPALVRRQQVQPRQHCRLHRVRKPLQRAML